MNGEIIAVNSQQEWEQFLLLPRLIYTGKELAKLTPPEIINRKFDRQYNPFLAHIKWIAFLARGKRQPLGRIVASIDYKCPHQNWGFFGFFECVEEESVARELLAAASNWLLQHNKLTVYGPVSLSTSDNLGCLVEGFQEANPFYLPYNPPYYNKLLINSGFETSHDLYAYSWHNSYDLSERIIRIGQRLEKSAQVKIRPINYRQLKREALFFHQIYNQAMVKNWGHVPLTEEEAYFILASHRPLIPPEYFLWAEVEGIPVGLCMALPNFNKRSLRLILLAVRPDFNHLGLSAILIKTIMEVARLDKINYGELSFVHEQNAVVNKLIRQDTGSLITKRYRIYRKALT